MKDEKILFSSGLEHQEAQKEIKEIKGIASR